VNTTQDSKRSAPPPDLTKLNKRRSENKNPQAATPAIEEIEVILKKKQKHQTDKERAKEVEKERLEKVKTKVRADFQLGISQYGELKFEPVFHIGEHEYSIMRKKEKKILAVQAQMFGKDMV
jgi:hypothetical protein